MALTLFDMEGVNRDLLAAGNPAKPDMQSILRRNARDLVLGNAILVSSVDAKELEFGVHMAYSDADGGFDTDPSEDVWFEASSLPIPNERPDLPPDNALRIRVTDVLTEYGFTDIDVKAPDRTPEGIWIGFEAMQPVRLDVTSAQEGRSVSFTLTKARGMDPISSDREIGAFLNTFDKLAAMPEPTPAKQEKDELSAGACDPADPLNLEQSSSYGMTR